MFLVVESWTQNNGVFEKTIKLSKNTKEYLKDNNKIDLKEIVGFNKKNKEVIRYSAKILTDKYKKRIKLKLENKGIIFQGDDFDYLKDNYLGELEKGKLEKADFAKYLLKNQFVVKDIEYYVKKIKEHVQSGRHNFYRGQRVEHWSAAPSLYRKENRIENVGSKEAKIYADIRKANFPEFVQQDDFINELVHMQHYGIPTPLLDWTKSPLVALFFAIQPNGDGKVSIASTNNLINFSEDKFKKISNIFKYIFENNKKSALSELNEELKLLNEKVHFIETIHENERIKAQNGFFSISLPCYILEENIMSKILKDDLDNILKNLMDEEKIRIGDKELIINKCLEILKGLNSEIQEQLRECLDYDLQETTSITVEERDDMYFKISTVLSKFKLKTYNHDVDGNAIIILSKDKSKILEELERIYGINTTNIYPDVTGYIDHLKKNY